MRAAIRGRCGVFIFAGRGNRCNESLRAFLVNMVDDEIQISARYAFTLSPLGK